MVGRQVHSRPSAASAGRTTLDTLARSAYLPNWPASSRSTVGRLACNCTSASASEADRGWSVIAAGLGDHVAGRVRDVFERAAGAVAAQDLVAVGLGFAHQGHGAGAVFLVGVGPGGASGEVLHHGGGGLGDLLVHDG